MLDLIQKRFGYGQSVCSKNWARSHMPDLTSCIQFRSVLPEKAWIILSKTGLDLIWMAWSDFGQMHQVQNKLVCKKHKAQFWQNVTSLLPVSHFQTHFIVLWPLLLPYLQNASMDYMTFIMHNYMWSISMYCTYRGTSIKYNFFQRTLVVCTESDWRNLGTGAKPSTKWSPIHVVTTLIHA